MTTYPTIDNHEQWAELVKGSYTVENVFTGTCKALHVLPDQMRHVDKFKWLSNARFIFCYLSNRLTYSKPEAIAKFICRNRTSALNAINTTQDWIDINDEQIIDKLNLVINELKGL